MAEVSSFEILNNIRSVSKRVKILTRAKYRTLGKYSSTTLENHFGSFSGALAVAGVKNVSQR